MTDEDATEVRECVCGREFSVVIKYARPWTVCPDCMTDPELNGRLP